MPEIGQIVVEHLPGVSVVALTASTTSPPCPPSQPSLTRSSPPARNVIVDLSEATFIDSGVVGVLFHAATPRGRNVAIAAAPGSLPRRLIDMVALTASAPTFDSRDAAIAYATRQDT
ncbi:MAG TPA: STAS domain-containing protein [Gaiellales bacterium]|nr:STAS domain-containing protein [Gaiellales bacterium]